MTKPHSISLMLKIVMGQTLALLALALLMMTMASVAWGQDNSTTPQTQTPEGAQQQTPDQTQEGQPSEPAPALVNPVAPVVENPPISGLDTPGLGKRGTPMSYLQYGAHLSESVDSNVDDTLGGSSVHTITTGLGSLALQRLWQNYDLALDYVGGVGYYNLSRVGLKQIQQFDVDQRVRWKRGQLGIRDSFSYLPEGNFAGAYGALNLLGEEVGGGSFSGSNVLMGGTTFGSLAQIPRITNLALVDAVENLTPKSAITASGGYGLVHYTGDNPETQGIGFLGSTQLTGQVGYDRIFGKHDQAAIVYAYQNFAFASPAAPVSAFHTNLIQLMWGHRISGRMDFLLAAGPQLTSLTVSTAENTRLTVSGRAQLRYRFRDATTELSFNRYTTSGSGLFAGARTNVGRLGVSKPLNRVYTLFLDAGYSANAREQSLTEAQLLECSIAAIGQDVPPCPGTVANKYSYGFAGAGIHRQIGHDLRVFASYQFNYLSFDTSFCTNQAVGSTPGAALPPCNRIAQRHVGAVGLNWTPRPIRID